MPTITLGDDSYIALPYRARRHCEVMVEVESERSTEVWALDEDALPRFEAGKVFGYIWHSRGKTVHEGSFFPAYNGEWYLVIQNFNPSPIAIHYEVYTE